MLKEVLTRWHSRSCFETELRPHLRLDRIWSSENKIIRDAWVALQFAKHSRAVGLCMTEDTDRSPDFQIRLPTGRVLDVQASEAQFPGRRRGDEYRIWRDSGWVPRRYEGAQKDDNL